MKLHSTFSSQSQLTQLEITGQQLTGDSLDLFCTVFKENKKISKLLLSDNQLGLGQNMEQKMKYFLESFLNDLFSPLELDLSYNRIKEDSLRPIIEQIFANTKAMALNLLNLEWNDFSNYSKRTILVAYSRCRNKKLQFKFGPLPMSQATLRKAVAVTQS